MSTIDYEHIRRFYDAHRADAVDDPEFTRGTVESSLGLIRFRNRAEARHLRHFVRLSGREAVLDLGGGSGRWSLWFARRCQHVTMVDVAPSLVASARRNAQRAGAHNITCAVGSILNPPLGPEQTFDVIHIGGVLVYINDTDLAQVGQVVRRHARPGARLVVREPVDCNGPSMDGGGNGNGGSDGVGSGYRAIWRRPQAYRELFARDWQLRYEQTTVSHLVPRGHNTASVVRSLQASPARLWLVDHLLPAMGYIDYYLLRMETILRSSPLAGFLGDPGVIQRFYLFERL